jgi:hypothetical protein
MRGVRQEVVAQQEADATTNQRTRGTQQAAGVTRGRGAGVAVGQPTRGREVLTASGKRQQHDKKQRMRGARQEVVT